MSVNDMKRGPARHIQLKKGSLMVKWRLATYRFRFDENYIGWERHGMLAGGSHKYDLWQFLAVPTTETSGSESSIRALRSGGLALAACVVTFFSEIPSTVPLLAPAFLIIAVVYLISGLLGLRGVTRTQFYRDGQALVSIPHGRVVSGDLDAFIDGLAAAIQKARERVYESDAV